MFKLPNIPNYLGGNKQPIGWSVSLTDLENTYFLDAVSDKPEKIVAQKLVAGGITYCPAFAGYYKNVFAIKMPFTIILNKLDGKLSAESSPNISMDKKHIVRIDKDDLGYNVQILLNNLFVSDKPYTTIETMPPILHGCKEEIVYLNGKFDIHAWQRPLHFGFRIDQSVFEKLDHDTSIIFDKGSVVQYVRINTPDDKSVTLHQFSPDDLKEVSMFVNRNTGLNSKLHLMNYKEIWNRVRYRRPTKFLRDLKYDNN